MRRLQTTCLVPALCLLLASAGAPAHNHPAPPVVPEAPAAAAAGQVYLTVPEALALAFPGCDVERGTVYLSKEQRRRAKEVSGVEAPAIAHPYVARKEGKLVGTAYFDVHKVRTLKETLMVTVTPDGRIDRIEVLAFGEPTDYIPRDSWYGQFPGRALDDELNLGRGIRNVTGATLTARATTNAARRVLGLHTVLEAEPAPASTAGPSAGD
jgi:hypothetical protein